MNGVYGGSGAPRTRRCFVEIVFLALLAVLIGGLGQSLSAHPYYAPADCSGCHGDVSAMSTTPASGGILKFLKTLVGRSSTASFTITNTSTAGPGIAPSFGGGGFSGSFPAASGPFAPKTSQTFNALAPSGALSPYTFLLPPAVVSSDGGQSSISQVYTFTPTARGTSNQPITFTPSEGFPNTVPSSTITLSGQGVAPVISLNTSSAAVGPVRIGATGTARLTINNIGDGNQAGAGLGNLTGTVAAGSGGFSGSGGNFNLADSGSQTFSYTISPISHGGISTNVAVNAGNGSTDGANSAQNLAATLSATGVGPVLATSLAANSTLNFSPQALAKPLTLANVTTDADLGSLTNLDILSASVSGANASLFSLSGISNGTLLTKSQSANLQISFVPGSFSGNASATLTLVTDEGAASGLAGKSVSFLLDGAVGPTGFYWKGGHGGAWNASSPGYNWVVASGSTTEVSSLPTASDDVFFSDPNPITANTTLGQNMSVKSVTFSGSSAPMTIGGSNTLTIAAGLTVSGGTASHTINAPIQLGAAQTWTVNGSGNLTVSGAVGGVGPLTKNGPGQLLLSGSNSYSGGTNVTAGTLEVGAGAAVPLATNVSIAGSGSAIKLDNGLTAAAKVGGLTIDNGSSSPQAVFDLGNGKLIVDKSITSLATIRNQISAGRNGGSWTGDGITSSAAAADVLAGGGTASTALGYADNSDAGMGLTTFGGQPVDSKSILLRYTLLGDANLDGKVNLSDFAALRGNFGTTSNATWDQSDFDYDGKVNLSDFAILRAHFGQSLPAGLVGASVPAAAAASPMLAPVPEPATVVLAAAAGLIALGASRGRSAICRKTLWRRGIRRPR